ncbi:MAG: hypothetical protein IKW89_01780 [Bacteroidales bacterium]|nr:hypothetical protein [Bacteroidales bacterium]
MKTKKSKASLVVDKIPSTGREAFKILDTMLSDEEKKSALAQSRSVFAMKEHFGLGAWIRNNWIYGDEKGIGLFAKEEALLQHPDSLSSDFLERYHDHLKRSMSKG